VTPIYEYECQACGEGTEKIQKATDKPIRKCPACGALRLRRKVSRSAFHLKGAGWYATGGYGSNGKDKKKAGAESASEGGSGDGASEKKADAKPEPKAEAKAESKPESKPAGKKKD